jgi:ribosomal protein S18 acetylase RimI-like enzyme
MSNLRIGEDHGMAIELRPATPDDTDAIVAVFHAARRRALPYLPVLHSPEEARAFFGGLVAAGTVTVAVEGEHVVAFIALGEGTVEHLYVEPPWWRHGIGSTLLRHAQARAPAGLALWVFARNTNAIAFYERHGFRVAQRTDGAGNEEREPDARMVWRGA